MVTKETKRYILIGGPVHGAERDIENGENEVTILSPSQGNPIPTPFKYIRRAIQAETRPGVVFQRNVFVEQSISPEIASQALAAILLENFANELVRQWMEGGTPIGTDHEQKSSGTVDGLQRSSSGSSNTASGIIVPSH
jgi:hypothetical protein